MNGIRDGSRAKDPSRSRRRDASVMPVREEEEDGYYEWDDREPSQGREDHQQKRRDRSQRSPTPHLPQHPFYPPPSHSRPSPQQQPHHTPFPAPPLPYSDSEDSSHHDPPLYSQSNPRSNLNPHSAINTITTTHTRPRLPPKPRLEPYSHSRSDPQMASHLLQRPNQLLLRGTDEENAIVVKPEEEEEELMGGDGDGDDGGGVDELRSGDLLLADEIGLEEDIDMNTDMDRGMEMHTGRDIENNNRYTGQNRGLRKDRDGQRVRRGDLNELDEVGDSYEPPDAGSDERGGRGRRHTRNLHGRGERQSQGDPVSHQQGQNSWRGQRREARRFSDSRDRNSRGYSFHSHGFDESGSDSDTDWVVNRNRTRYRDGWVPMRKRQDVLPQVFNDRFIDRVRPRFDNIHVPTNKQRMESRQRSRGPEEGVFMDDRVPFEDNRMTIEREEYKRPRYKEIPSPRYTSGDYDEYDQPVDRLDRYPQSRRYQGNNGNEQSQKHRYEGRYSGEYDDDRYDKLPMERNPNRSPPRSARSRGPGELDASRMERDAYLDGYRYAGPSKITARDRYDGQDKLQSAMDDNEEWFNPHNRKTPHLDQDAFRSSIEFHPLRDHIPRRQNRLELAYYRRYEQGRMGVPRRRDDNLDGAESGKPPYRRERGADVVDERYMDPDGSRKRKREYTEDLDEEELERYGRYSHHLNQHAQDIASSNSRRPERLPAAESSAMGYSRSGPSRAVADIGGTKNGQHSFGSRSMGYSSVSPVLRQNTDLSVCNKPHSRSRRHHESDLSDGDDESGHARTHHHRSKMSHGVRDARTTVAGVAGDNNEGNESSEEDVSMQEQTPVLRKSGRGRQTRVRYGLDDKLPAAGDINSKNIGQKAAATAAGLIARPRGRPRKNGLPTALVSNDRLCLENCITESGFFPEKQVEAVNPAERERLLRVPYFGTCTTCTGEEVHCIPSEEPNKCQRCQRLALRGCDFVKQDPGLQPALGWLRPLTNKQTKIARPELLNLIALNGHLADTKCDTCLNCDDSYPCWMAADNSGCHTCKWKRMNCSNADLSKSLPPYPAKANAKAKAKALPNLKPIPTDVTYVPRPTARQLTGYKDVAILPIPRDPPKIMAGPYEDFRRGAPEYLIHHWGNEWKSALEPYFKNLDRQTYTHYLAMIAREGISLPEILDLLHARPGGEKMTAEQLLDWKKGKLARLLAARNRTQTTMSGANPGDNPTTPAVSPINIPRPGRPPNMATTNPQNSSSSTVSIVAQAPQIEPVDLDVETDQPSCLLPHSINRHL